MWKTIAIVSTGILFAAHSVWGQAEIGVTPPESVRVPAGFCVELVYAVPAATQGSWVAMTADDHGRLVVSDQYGKLYSVTPPSAHSADGAADAQVLPIHLDIGQAQGLLCAFDSLYVTVNREDGKSGLYRLLDTNRDGQWDDPQLVLKIDGGGEHGPHAVITDGRSLYLCAGNHTPLPRLTASRLPRNWGEDQLLPRMWDPQGHAVGILAPGGWICRLTPDGRECELVAAGFRNQYDLAFNVDGELFTFDSDMEWDMGTAWYRPTRILHVTSGADFGWRSGSGKWPADYPDTLPSVVDVGPGSPTGLAFGTGTRFPPRYRQALFAADWSYGILYAIHLRAQGASYAGQVEPFATAPALPLTDIVALSQDGALYFLVGGRRVQSALYRIRYVGSEEPGVSSVDGRSESLRQLRREIEAFHGPRAAASELETIWSALAHDDVHIRYAARIALEHQSVASWRDRVLTAQDRRRQILGVMALVRCHQRADPAAVVDALLALPWDKLSDSERLALLRVGGLALIRLHDVPAETKTRLTAYLDPHFPGTDLRLNRELASLLVYLEAPDIVERVLGMLDRGVSQPDLIHYLAALRTAKQGWTLERRERYFRCFHPAKQGGGGKSFGGYLDRILQDARDTLSEAEMARLQAVLAAAELPATPAPSLPARPLVKEWTLEELVEPVLNQQGKRDLQRGETLFAAAQCDRCHRINGQGGVVGPDLSAVGKRMSVKDLLRTIVDPSHEIPDQYRTYHFTLNDGRVLTGRVVDLVGDEWMVATDLYNPGERTRVHQSQIEEMTPSQVSSMPAGLLNTLKLDEILDLLAYLQGT
jgi:hypothetical protein